MKPFPAVPRYRALFGGTVAIKIVYYCIHAGSNITEYRKADALVDSVKATYDRIV